MPPLARLKLALKTSLPRPLFESLLDRYHLAVALGSALFFGFPSHNVRVVGVTGTKGKSSTVEMIHAICAAHGWKTAVLDSIREKVHDESRPNTRRMSMPGRAFIQSFLSRAIAARCDIVILEMTSEGARQHRHRGIALDALVFTNLAPEHIESHGSFEAYAAAKYELGLQLVRSSKRPRIMVANADDAAGPRFLTLPVEQALPFSLSATEHHASDQGSTFRFADTEIHTPQPGTFSLENALAAATLCRALGIPVATIARGLGSVTRIPGRAEAIDEGQSFTVVVDYAHTPDSLRAIYAAYTVPGRSLIGVLGSMGGGRDTWKRPAMGTIAAQMCETVILTNEDPCDEDPRSIIEQIAAGMKGIREPLVIDDRRAAIRRAFELAREKAIHESVAVIITGKGTDTSIKGPRGSAVPWSDAGVAREELHALRTKSA